MAFFNQIEFYLGIYDFVFNVMVDTAVLVTYLPSSAKLKMAFFQSLLRV